MTNQSSFDNIRAWLSEIRQYAEEDVVIMLLGNKVDKATRVITKEQGEKLAKVKLKFNTTQSYLFFDSKMGLKYYCSAQLIGLKKAVQTFDQLEKMSQHSCKAFSLKSY